MIVAIVGMTSVVMTFVAVIVPFVAVAMRRMIVTLLRKSRCSRKC